MRNIYLSLFSFIPLFVFGQSQDVVTQITDFEVTTHVVKPHEDSDVSVNYISTGFQNYQFTDLEGGTHDIYAELGQGKTVVLAFMNYFTTMCQNEVKYLNHIKDIYQTQEDMVRLWGIEISELNTLNAGGIDLDVLYQNWGLTYPLINLDGLDSYLSNLVTSVPTYIVIKPDHSYTVISTISNEEDVLSHLNQSILTASSISADYDVDLYNVEHDYCNGSVNLYLSVQNTGVLAHTAFQVKLTDNSGTVIDQVNIPNTLTPKSRVEVSLLYGANQITDTEFNVEIISGYATENHRNNKAEVNLVESMTSSSGDIQLRLQTDDYPAETAWHLRDNTIGEFTDSAGIGANGAITGLTQGLHTYNFELDDNHCYTLHVYDSFGDGICCSNGNGYFKVYDTSSGALLVEGGNFQLSEKAHFRILPEMIGVDEYVEHSSKEILSINYYDLLGRSYTEPKLNMVMLKRTIYTDNSTKSEKIHLK